MLATKAGYRTEPGPNGMGASRYHLIRACEASLRRLRTETIDLYQIHWPDPLTPQAETLQALDDLVRAGKVRYVGCSNYAGWQVADAAWIAETRGLNPFVSAQNQYSLLNRDIERDLVPACEHFGLGLLPFFPLASGLLTGKYSHLNGFHQNGDVFDGGQQTMAKLLQAAGYRTAVVGKWHLESAPTGFDSVEPRWRR